MEKILFQEREKLGEERELFGKGVSEGIEMTLWKSASHLVFRNEFQCKLLERKVKKCARHKTL